MFLPWCSMVKLNYERLPFMLKILEASTAPGALCLVGLLQCWHVQSTPWCSFSSLVGSELTERHSQSWEIFAFSLTIAIATLQPFSPQNKIWRKHKNANAGAFQRRKYYVFNYKRIFLFSCTQTVLSCAKFSKILALWDVHWIWRIPAQKMTEVWRSWKWPSHP